MSLIDAHIFRAVGLFRILIVAFVLMPGGCVSRNGGDSPFMSCDTSGWELIVGSDSVVTRAWINSGLSTYTAASVDARADSILSGELRSIPSFGCGLPVVDASYRLGTSLLAVKADSGAIVSPYAVYLAYASLDPDLSRRSLESLVADGRIRAFDYGKLDSDVCRWPLNSSTRLMWALAAWKLYCITYDKEWLAYAYQVIDRSIAADVMVLHDPEYTLFHGSDIDDPEMLSYHYPAWMSPTDVYQTMSLTVNVLAERSMHVLALMAQELGSDPTQHNAMSRTLRDAINDHLWLPNLGYYSQYLYGGAFPIQSYAADSRGEAFAAAFGTASDAQSRLMLARVPRTPYGLAVQFPLMPRPGFMLADMTTEAIWALAARNAGNGESLSASLSSLIRRVVCADTAVSYRTVSFDDCAAVYAAYVEALSGIDFRPDGIMLCPVIPDGMKGPVNVTGLSFGEAEIDISIVGTGNVVSSVEIDGLPVEGSIIPRGLKGKHNVKVSVTKSGNNSLFRPNAGIAVMPPVWAPQTPRVNTSGSKRIHIANYTDSLSYAVYVNGQRVDDISSGSYPRLKAKGYTSVSFVPIASYRWFGYSSSPYAYIPRGGEIRIQAEDFATPVSFVRSVRADHDSLVEISPQINKRLSMNVDVSEDGNYLIEVRYADTPLGGPVAMRSLFVNGRRCGVIVMPRLGRHTDSDRMGFSSSVKAVLNAGANTVSLDYIIPYNTNPEDEANSVLVDCVILIKL